MKTYVKTFIGGMIAFFVGTSCCWLSSLAIWIGGAAFIGVLVQWIESLQVQLIVLGIVLVMVSGYLYWRKKSD